MEKTTLNDAIKNSQIIEAIRNELPEVAVGQKGLQSPSCYSYNQAVIIPNMASDNYYKIIDKIQTSQAICIEIMGKTSGEACTKIYNILNSSNSGLVAKCTVLENTDTVCLYRDDNRSIYVRRKTGFVSMLRISSTTDPNLKLKLEPYTGNTENFTLIG